MNTYLSKTETSPSEDDYVAESGDVTYEKQVEVLVGLRLGAINTCLLVKQFGLYSAKTRSQEKPL